MFDIEGAIAIKKNGLLRLIERCATDCARGQRVANALQPFGGARVFDISGEW